MSIAIDSKWITFIEHTYTKKDRKTKIYHVVTKASNNTERLGVIMWYGAWRKYAFFPDNKVQTIFEAQCLTDITSFLTLLMDERKQMKTATS